MSWQGIEGHDQVIERFRRGLGRNRLASTFLFVGPPGIGKRSLALKLAQALLCRTNPDELLEPCGHCPSCVQVAALTHPDLELISRPPDKSVLPVEKFIGAKEKRGQEGLCHNISLKPFMGGRRIAIIDDADDLGDEGANALLKTLEEPPPKSVLILIGTSADKQLPTIRSRCQVIRFQPLDEHTEAGLLVSTGAIDDPNEARRIARYSEGSLQLAANLADAELWDFRRELLAALAEPAIDSVARSAAVLAFVDRAGKEAAPRRARLRQVLAFAAEFYRQVLRGLCGAALTDDPELNAAVRQALSAWSGDEETASACVARCLEALAHVDRNAHQAAIVECWLDDLARIIATGHPITSERGTAYT